LSEQRHQSTGPRRMGIPIRWEQPIEPSQL